MKKIIYLFSIAVFLQTVKVKAQEIQFEQAFPPSPVNAYFEPAGASCVAVADVDVDGDLDVLISGYYGEDFDQMVLYLNDGQGNFTQITDNGLVGVEGGFIAFSDIDNDGDQDVFIIGYDAATDSEIAKLYTNDGSGNFTEVTDTPFTGIVGGFATFADLDNDGDSDLMISGASNGEAVTKLYTNDGSGNFTEVTDTPFIGLMGSSIAISDIDNDSDLDVLLTGYTGSERVAKLYTNDGNGNFTEVTDTPFIGVSGNNSSLFSDIDNDGDQDVLLTGYTGSDPMFVSILYTNDGSGNFTEVTDTPFEGFTGNSIAFNDIDNDGDQDVVFCGYTFDSDSKPTIKVKLFTNNGSGEFTEVTDIPFVAVDQSSIVFFDMDSDGDSELLIAGRSKSILYMNEGEGHFIKITNSFFEGVDDSSVAFADVDNDGDQDVLITGYTNNYDRISKLYTNDGSGIFTEVADTPFEGVDDSSIAFSDVDNDGDQDVLITGYTDNSERISKLYTNDGSGIFTEVADTPFEGVDDSSIAFADIDNDGDQDVLITGYTDNSERISKLYTNDGSGIFTEVADTPFEGVDDSSIAFSDVDNDGDQDVLITGYTNNSERISKLYTNDDSGIFTEVTDTPFEGVNDSSIAFSDVDNDGDQDVLITGYTNDYERISKLYINDGSGIFTEVTDTPFEGVDDSSVAFSDVDNDGDQDILITGYIEDTNAMRVSDGIKISKLYTNDGSGIFTEVADTPFEGIDDSSIALADVDNDGDQDVLITGYTDNSERISYLYRNLYDLLGITENQNATTNLKVYPNPSSNLFTLDCNSQSIDDIKIYNLQGQEMPFVFDKIQQTIQVSYPKGIYLIKLKINDKTQTMKIIVR